jgi:hypothetical protein
MKATIHRIVGRTTGQWSSLKVFEKVLPFVLYGGPSDLIAQPKIKTFFELSLVTVD